MPAFTFLFGAGASANAIPVINKLPESMHNAANDIRAQDLSLLKGEHEIGGGRYTASSLATKLADEIQQLADISLKHASIDTLAKKLFLKGDRNGLLKLKATLMGYLSYQQLRVKTDQRYDAFYASLLSQRFHDFPENVQIVTWNYDNQFEKSYQEFTDHHELNNVHYKFYKSDPKYYEGFGIYKINGSNVVLNQFRDCVPLFKLSAPFSNEELLTICRNYQYLLTDPRSNRAGISFAWEDDALIDVVKERVKGTNILVVIGYSFPYFNRVIDRKIVSEMNHLQKVYIQSPDAKKIKERMRSVMDISNKEFVLIDDDLDQFVLPFEL